MSAKVHSHLSNRTKARKQASERKPVLKASLENPFQVKWPTVAVNLQNASLSRLVLSLQELAAYHSTRDALNRKRKRISLLHLRSNKRSKLATDNDALPASSDPHQSDTEADSSTPHSPPVVLSHLTLGINQVTKRLESQARSYRQTISTSADPPDEHTRAPIRYVFVCRADVDPPLLIAHIPTLIAACNSSRRSLSDPTSYPPIKLVPLPLGAEFTLAEATGLRRLSIIALDADTPDLGYFDSLLDLVPILRESWLTPVDGYKSELPRSVSLVPTHIKQTRTTAPVNMKAAKDQRSKGRAEAKLRKKQHKVAVTTTLMF